jgi:hypothetical protein
MMKLKTIASIAGFGLLGAVAGTAPAAAMSVDGSLAADWGIAVQDYTGPTGGCGDVAANCIGTNWTGSQFSTVQNYNGTNNVQATLLGGALKLGSSLDNNIHEDGNDISNNYGGVQQLNPYSGGQNFDAEFMGVAQSNGKLFITIVSGQRPDNLRDDFEPGDLKLTITSGGGPANGLYGIELGGGKATNDGGSGAAITGKGGAGSTYVLNANGYSTGETATTNKVGDVVKGATYIPHPLNTPLSDNTQMQDGTGTKTMEVDAIYETQDSVGNQHNIIELELDIATLLGTTDKNAWTAYNLDLLWGPGCGNDVAVTGVQFAANDIPEPAGLALFGLGALGLGFLRRRKTARKAA